MADVNVGISFAAGFASFISPCCLPLYPAYLSYITGVSVTDIKTDTSTGMRMRTMSHTFFFISDFPPCSSRSGTARTPSRRYSGTIRI